MFLSSCSPGYVLRSAYEQGKILSRRQNIDEVLEKQETPQDIKSKLQLVLEARQYAISIGLDPKKTFTQYSKVDKDILAWIVLASKMDSFTLYTWWFPIVGSVPYKGYFEIEDAKEEAADLSQKGYETWVRGTEAFSTLGWFNDPVLSTTLHHNEVSIANTVIHESVHTTFWLSGHVDFNESLANFIATFATCDFFRSRLDQCSQSDEICKGNNTKFIDQCEKSKAKEIELTTLIIGLYDALNYLYTSELPTEQKLVKRTEIFNQFMANFKNRYPSLQILKTLNNAEIMQLKLYLTGFSEFDSLWQRQNHSFSAMLEQLEKNKDTLQASRDPFSLLKND